MNTWLRTLLPIVLLLGILRPAPDGPLAKDLVRPEEVRSLREVVYARDTYVDLARLWKEYHKEYPSEYAYAYWMYAARYARDEAYPELLDRGLKEYPANPVLLYLKGNEICMRYTSPDRSVGVDYLKRAAELDPRYMDPWFTLVTEHMMKKDQAALEGALRRLLEGAAIEDAVLDYNYNMLACLDENAILITNGDNDTFPGWILTRLLGHRPDVQIVNRSLLNTEWYPLHVMEEGVPRFIAEDELVEFRRAAKGPTSDALIQRLVAAAKKGGRPVYFAVTMYFNGEIARLRDEGNLLGLAYRVTPGRESYFLELDRLLQCWLSEFLTGGLDSWALRHGNPFGGGRMLVKNYASGLFALVDTLNDRNRDTRRKLFLWYRNHLADVLPEEYNAPLCAAWLEQNDLPEARSWCKSRRGEE